MTSTQDFKEWKSTSNRHTDATVHKEFTEYFQAAMKDPREWKQLVEKEKEFPDEVFAAGTDLLPQFLARWDKETGALRIHRDRCQRRASETRFLRGQFSIRTQSRSGT